MEEKPIVVLSCDVDDEDRIRLLPQYFQSISDAGGIPVIMPPFVERSKMSEWLGRIGANALVLTGGADVDPQLFRERAIPELGRVSLVRDVYELELFDCALERYLPVLGICRGMQVINVAFGGTLVQDMPVQLGSRFALHQQEAPTEETVHEVRLDPDSRVARLFGGAERIAVNSHHHQCIKHLGTGLKVCGQAPDGIIEAIEHAEFPVVAVQFHPERMPDVPVMANFFKEWTRYVASISGEKLEMEAKNDKKW